MSVENRNASNASPGAEDVFEEMSRPQTAQNGHALTLERRLLQWVLEQLGRAPLCCVLWDGSRVSAGGVEPECELHIRDRGALWKLISYPEYQFPEMYVQGRIGAGDDLERVLAIVQHARRNRAPDGLRQHLLSALFQPRSGSPAKARENIHRHYDIGNDFYRLWLDEQMIYTCAYFPTPETTLEAAQTAKMDLVCRKLRLQPGERVVEAGCGWGALALQMARHYGAKVRAFNISKAQLDLARQRALREGLSDAVEFVEADYREISGEYDVFVSVGMLEHVGLRHYGELGQVMDRCLSANGRGLIHTIGTDRPGNLNTWIERRIFPGAHPPSLGEMMRLFGPNDFSILDVENLRQHYALTLQHWLNRFDAAQDEVLKMFDREFLRTWRFYLAASETAFTAGHLQLFQVLFARSGCNGIPWTRAHLYQDGRF